MRAMRIKSPLFVGRREELGRLSDWLDEAREGGPRVVVVGGEAGIGKSRLVGELARVAGERDMRQLSGAAADYGEGGLPFGAVAEALRPVLARAGRRGVGGGSGDLLAEGGLAPAADLSVGAAGISQQHAFERLLGLLERVAAERPTLLVLEDLHWADTSTREFLAFLSRNLGGLRLLVVGTYRTDDVTRDHPLWRYLAELERAGRIERLELSRFGRDELRQQLEAIRGEQVEPALVERLFARSEGNPFFAEEVFAAESHGAPPGTMPATLRDILLARIEVLPLTSRRVLEAAAVAGRAADEFLAGVTGLDHGEVLTALREAISRHVLEPVANPAALGHAFRHALLREAIYDDLLPGERVRLHRRVAEVMTENLGGAADAARASDSQLLAQLAHHWLQANRAEEAFVASWRAGAAAERAYAYPEASRHFERVLELWSRIRKPERLLRAELARSGDTATTADRATALLRAAVASAIAGDVRREVQLYREAQGLLDETAETERSALLRINLMEALLDRGDAQAAKQEHQRALALVPAIDSAETRASVLLALSHHLILDYGDSLLELGNAALEAARQAGSPLHESQAHVKLGRHLCFMGRLDEGMQHFAAARSTAEADGLEDVVAGAEKERAIILECAARFEEALEALELAQEIWLRLGVLRGVRHNDAMIGQVLHRLGRWREAEEALARAVQPPAAEWAFVVRGYLYVGMGRMADARRDLARAWETVEDSNSSASYGPYYSALAELALWEGRPQEALEVIGKGLSYAWDGRWLGEYARLRMRALADRADVQRATEVLDELHKQACGAFDYGNVYSAELRASLLSAEAEARRARGEWDAAGWGRAAAAWSELKERYPEAYSLFRQAEAFISAGDRSKAAGPLRRAVELCRDMGAVPLFREAESLARRARIEVSRIGVPAGERATAEDRASADQPASADDYGLTARERDVLALLAQGRSDRQIAEALFISPKTASVHVSNIKAKLGVQHRIEAAAIGLRLGPAEEGAAGL